jgi:diamine N-acetyltransferase
MIHIVKAKPADMAQLRQLAIETFTDTYAAKNDPIEFAKYLEQAFEENSFMAHIHNTDIQYFIAIQGLKWVGYIKLNCNDAQTEPEGTTAIELERIYVLSEFKGQKIGQKLIERAMEIGKSLGKNYLWLGVWEQNPEAIAFYEKMGFTVYGTHVFTIGNENQTDYMMRKYL